MKNRIRLTGYLSLIAVVFSLWVFSGCSKSSDAAPTMTILDLMASASFKESATVTDDKALDSLVKYVNLYQDLKTVLGATGTSMTYFAPSNKAFKNLLATPGFPSNIKLINPALIQGVLYYHLVNDQKLSSSLTSGTVLNSNYIDATTSAVQTITVNSDLTLLTGSTNKAIHIVTADQKATNGVMHVVESVMIPPTVGASLTPILGTVAGTILLGADFTDLASIISKADATFTESTPNLAFKITTWLAMPINGTPKTGGGTNSTANLKGVTFFAVPNAVFKAAATTAGVSESALVTSLSTTADAARAFLLNHLVVTTPAAPSATGQYTVADAPSTNTYGIVKFANAQTITPMSGSTKNITVVISSSIPYSHVAVTNKSISITAAYAPIVTADVGHTNGQAQVIGGMLGN